MLQPCPMHGCGSHRVRRQPARPRRPSLAHHMGRIGARRWRPASGPQPFVARTPAPLHVHRLLHRERGRRPDASSAPIATVVVATYAPPRVPVEVGRASPASAGVLPPVHHRTAARLARRVVLLHNSSPCHRRPRRGTPRCHSMSRPVFWTVGSVKIASNPTIPCAASRRSTRPSHGFRSATACRTGGQPTQTAMHSLSSPPRHWSLHRRCKLRALPGKAGHRGQARGRSGHR